MALTPISYSTNSTQYGRQGSRLTNLNGISPGSTGTRTMAAMPGAGALQAGGQAPDALSRVLSNNQNTFVPPAAIAPPSTQTAPAAPAAPAPKPQSQTGSQSSAATAPTLDSDPILQQIRALAQSNDQQAQHAATAGKEQLLENYGDPALASSLGLGSNVAGVAAQNPNSTLAQLLMGHNQNVNTIDQNDNKANLFYSSTRAHHLADEGRNYQTGRYNAEQNVRGQLGQIDQTLAQALAASQAQQIQGAADAYNRYLSTNPTLPPGTETPAAAAPTDTGAPQGVTNVYGTSRPAQFLDANNPNVDRLALALATAARGRQNIGY